MTNKKLSLTTAKTSPVHGIKKRLLVVATLAVPLFITSGLSNQSQQAMCQKLNASNEAISQCLANTGANNSWMSWLTGSSRSAQFQMIDLFELVNRPSENAETGVITTREG